MTRKKKPGGRAANQFALLTTAELAEAVAPHWQQLTAMLPSLGETEVHRLLCWELAHRRNRAILVRLHQRWTRLRAARERAAMLKDWVVP